MTKFHINGKGEVLPCVATIRDCDFGDKEDHYTNESDARVAYENSQSEQVSNSLKKKNTSYNKEILDKLDFDLTINSNKTLLMKTLDNFFKENNKNIPYDMISSQSLASKMGNLLEQTYTVSLNFTFRKNRMNKIAVRGNDLSQEIKIARHLEKKELNDEINRISSAYFADKKELKNLLSLPSKRISVPDIIVIDYVNNSVKVAEIKSSGQNDSSAVPENIDKMMHDTRNSAIGLWKNSPKFERAIVLAATEKNKNKFPHERAWQNYINKNNILDVNVVSNEMSYRWLSEINVEERIYHRDVVNTTARKIYEKLTSIMPEENTNNI